MLVSRTRCIRPRFTSQNSARKFDCLQRRQVLEAALEGMQGALMTVACGQCGTESPRTAKFCSECGAKLHQPSVEPERADADQMAEVDVPLPAHDTSDASRRPPRPAAPVSIEHGAKSRKIVLVYVPR